MYSKQLYKSCWIKRGSSQIEKSAENIISWLQSCCMVEYLTHKGKSRRQFPKNGVMRQRILRKLYPGQFHEYMYLPIKKYFFPKTGHDSEAFSRYWKKFPEIFLCHYPNFLNFKFYWKS